MMNITMDPMDGMEGMDGMEDLDGMEGLDGLDSLDGLDGMDGMEGYTKCSGIPGVYYLSCSDVTLGGHVIWDDSDPTRVLRYRKVGSGSKWKVIHPNMDYLSVTGPLLPGQTYQFGINIVENGNIRHYPNEEEMKNWDCTCTIPAMQPDPPKDIKSHYIQEDDYQLSWTPGKDNGAKIDYYRICSNHTESPKEVDVKNEAATPTDGCFNPVTTNETSVMYRIPGSEPTLVQISAFNSAGGGYPADVVVHQPRMKTRATTQSNGFLGSMSPALTYGLLGCVVAVLLLLIALVCYKRRKLRVDAKKSLLLSLRINGLSDSKTGQLELGTLEPLWHQEVNRLYGVEPLDIDSIDRVPQLPSCNIRFLRYLGCGAFGKVWEGWLKREIEPNKKHYERVALKVRNVNALTEEEFQREAILMYKYQHPNIVRLIAISYDRLGQQCLVLEMMEQGNLREFLHLARPQISAAHVRRLYRQNQQEVRSYGNHVVTRSVSQPSALTAQELLQQEFEASIDIPGLMGIMRDVVRGCRYLEDHHFVHRDIAARNCLVSCRHSSGRVVKLSDFGLARDIYKNDYYRRQNEPKLPLRWMSPEALRDGLFTSKSDVWAYAVTCWEVMTLGADPFYGHVNNEVMKLILGGQVLEKPENCPNELFDQLLLCWSHFSDMRPSFGDLEKKFEQFCAQSKDPDSPFSKPFVQKIPPECLARVAGYDGSLSSPTTEQTLLTGPDQPGQMRSPPRSQTIASVPSRDSGLPGSRGSDQPSPTYLDIQTFDGYERGSYPSKTLPSLFKTNGINGSARPRPKSDLDTLN